MPPTGGSVFTGEPRPSQTHRSQEKNPIHPVQQDQGDRNMSIMKAAQKERPTRDGTEPTGILGMGDSSVLILLEESSCLSLVLDNRVKNLKRLDESALCGDQAP